MKAKDALFAVAGVFIASFKAPIFALDVPSFKKVRLRTIDIVSSGDSSNPNNGTPWKPSPHEQLCLRGVIHDRQFETSWSMDIDVIECVIERADWHELFSKRDGSHGWDVLIMVLGIPGIIVTLPVLAPWWLFRSLLHKTTGLDIHQLVLWSKLRPQLSKDQRDVLLQGLRNMNNGVYWSYRSRRSNDQKAV